MGRKRKAVAGSAIAAAEDNTSNACSEPTTIEDKVQLHTNKTNAMEAMNVGNEVQPNSNGLPLMKKIRQVTTTVLRRSGRLRSSVLRSGSQGAKPVVKHIILVENEKDKAPNSQQVNTLPVLREKNTGGEPHLQQVTTVADSNGRNLEDEVESLILAVDEFKLQVPGIPNEGSSPDLCYKSLYIESQKKIEALTEANYELVKNLEFVRGQVAAVISNMRKILTRTRFCRTKPITKQV